MIDSNMWGPKPAPVVRNAPNVSYMQEYVKRKQDTTNTIEDDYEYSQPKSYRLVNSANFQVVNPFNTPCQVCLLYAQVVDTTGYLAVTFDNNDVSPLNLATNILDFPGILLTETSNAPLAPSLQWTDFQNFVQIRAQGITSFTEFCLLFRRKTCQIIPTNKTAFNSLDQ